MPRLRALAELDTSSTSAGSELTNRALSTWQSEDKEGWKLKSRRSVKSDDDDDDDDDDDATFNAEFSDFGDRCSMWRKRSPFETMEAEHALCAAP